MSVYDDVKDRLMLSCRDGYHAAAVREELAVLARSRGAFLDDIARSTERMTFVRQNSALHEDGFNRLILMAADDGTWRLRMNVWYGSVVERLRQSRSCHSHIWHHSSVVVAGRMINAFFQRQPGNDFHEYETERAGSAEMQAFEVGLCSVAPLRRLEVPAGETYSETADELHRVIPDSDEMATLCFQSFTELKRASLFTPRPWTGPRIDHPDWQGSDRFATEWQRSLRIALG